MTALALDASGPWLSLAIEKDGVLFEHNLHAPAKQNELLMRSIDNLFLEANIMPADLAFIACTSGPGSFTGLRIALSITKGLALARGIPLFTENTLLCQAQAAAADTNDAPNTPILSIQDGRKGSLFALLIQGERELLERGLYTAARLFELCAAWPQIRVCGDGSAVLSAENSAQMSKFSIVPAFERGFAKELLQRARLRYTIEPQGDSLDCGLDYMKKSEAEESLEARKAPPAP